MNDLTVSLSGAQLWNKSRSVGMKLIVICGLALLMVIPSFFVAGLIEDRTTQGNIQPRWRPADFPRSHSRHPLHHPAAIWHSCANTWDIPDLPGKGFGGRKDRDSGAPSLTVQGTGVSGRFEV